LEGEKKKKKIEDGFEIMIISRPAMYPAYPILS